MVTEVVAATEDVVTVKVAVLLPAATVTEAGTLAAVLLDDKDIVAPPVGAAALKVSVPVEDVPLATLDGLTETEESAVVVAGVMVSPMVLLVPL
jgi:hypothetical protein